ncbi:MAG: hypothetical protein EPO52_01190 [Herbiconiux sp.]|uniref:hypothetical protein n=1 Tax=Herbiconiux sp. TaxID=1871186 RepID=UPI0011FA3AA6|nr:hypothetical protein [Herbiconiux sp.]TAJ50082.1 MAG: hypothetical protein EPO52_01190 [Herbiconiux sp.]
MSSDDRPNDKPEFPMRNDGADAVEPGSQAAAPVTPPLPEIPAWQAPAAADLPPVDQPTAAPAAPVASEEPAPEESEELGVVERTDAPAEPIVDQTATREPLGGPYVVTESGAPIAEQAVIAYEREPQGGPYVTSSEPVAVAEPQPTPYPAAAFATPAAPAAVVAGAGAGVAAYPPMYQPVPQQILAPEQPKLRSNRGGGVLISLVGTIVFAVVFAAVSFVVISLSLSGSGTNAVSAFLSFLATAAFIVPVVVYAIMLILIVLIFNRAGWWVYVFGGFFVAVLVYVAGIAGALIHVQAWTMQPQEQYDFVRSLTMDPLTLAGAIVAREVTIWIGIWIALRARSVKADNAAARAEFTRSQQDARAAAEAAQAAPPTNW